MILASRDIAITYLETNSTLEAGHLSVQHNRAACDIWQQDGGGIHVLTLAAALC
jgi:hypothetical protein